MSISRSFFVFLPKIENKENIFADMTDIIHQTKRTVRILCSILLLSGSLPASAQQVRFGPLHSADSPREDWLLPGDTVVQAGKKMIYSGKPVKSQSLDSQEEKQDGLHVSVGLSAFATFGKNVPHHGGFTQTIDADYLTPLTKDGKLWLKVGGYLNNMNWGGDNYRDLGLYAVIGYKFNEHWEAYVYGQLSVANNYNTLYGRYMGYGYGMYGMRPYGMYPGAWGYGSTLPGGYGMGMPGANVLGAGVQYNVNKNFHIRLNVEGVWYNNKTPYYFDRYNYPVPPLSKTRE